MSDIDLSPVATFTHEAMRYQRIVSEVNEIIERLEGFRAKIEHTGRSAKAHADVHAKLAQALFNGVPNTPITVGGVSIFMSSEIATDAAEAKLREHMGELARLFDVMDGYEELIEIFRDAYARTIEARFPNEGSGQTG